MMERSALGIVVVPIRTATDDHFTLVRLGHIPMHRIGHHNHIHAGFDRFRHQRLKCDRFNWQTEARHIGQNARMARNHNAQFVAINRALGRVNADHLVPITAHACDFALLDDVHAHIRTGTCISPGHRIVTRGAPAWLPQCAQNRIARTVDVDDWNQLFHTLGRNEFCGHPL